MTNVKQRQLFGISAIIFIVLMLIATFKDLQISNTVINYNSIFGTLFQSVGEFPEYLIFIVSGQLALCAAFKAPYPLRFKFFLGLGGAGLSGWQLKQYLNEIESYFLSVSSNKQHNKPIGLANSDSSSKALTVAHAYMIWIVVFILITLLLQYWFSHFSLITIQHLLLIAVFACLTTWISLQVNQGLKNIWGRVRPYELNKGQTDYTNWLTINGVTGHMSFPSGHTQAATLLIVFSWFFNGQAKKNWWTIGIVYGVLMGISRVIIGAHFMSDVVFSFFMTALIIYTMRSLYLIFEENVIHYD